MENELLMLEGKLEQLLALVARLRSENTALTAQLTAEKSENDGLRATINTTKLRIELLVASIPDETEEAIEGGASKDDKASPE
jgi:cell division protein FtsB